MILRYPVELHAMYVNLTMINAQRAQRGYRPLTPSEMDVVKNNVRRNGGDVGTLALRMYTASDDKARETSND